MWGTLHSVGLLGYYHLIKGVTAVAIIAYADYACLFCLLAKKALRQAIVGRIFKYAGGLLYFVRIPFRP